MSDRPAPQGAGADQAPAERLAHLVIIAVLGAVAVGVIVTAAGFPASPDPNDVGAARFPMLYAVVLLGLLGILLVQTLRRPATADAATADALPAPEATTAGAALAGAAAPGRPRYGRVAIGMLLMLAALLAIGLIGYFPTALLLLVALMALMGQRSPVWNPLLALLLTAAIYVLFDYGLNVPLPLGSLFE